MRDGVLSYLARRPGTATEIARALGVSKATISYHTKALIRRDMIEIADIKSIRGGVYSKTYALKQGALALARRKDDQTGSLTKLDEMVREAPDEHAPGTRAGSPPTRWRYSSTTSSGSSRSPTPSTKASSRTMAVASGTGSSRPR